MNNIITRNPHKNESAALRDIWETAFGTAGMESFLSCFFDPELCMIAEVDNSPAAAGYLVPYGDLLCTVCSSDTIPCAMIYAVATMPEHRGKGLGTSVVNALIGRAHETGYPAVVLCPLDDGLFGYYGSRSELSDHFYVSELVLKDIPSKPVCGLPVPERINATIYNDIREEFLKDIVHIKHDLRIVEYQELLCSELGGGLYRIGDSCAIIERQNESTVWVKEFLSPLPKSGDMTSNDAVEKIMSVISGLFPAREYMIRFPSYIDKGRRFGMLAQKDAIGGNIQKINEAEYSPWYGIAFD